MDNQINNKSLILLDKKTRSKISYIQICQENAGLMCVHKQGCLKGDQRFFLNDLFLKAFSLKL